jgi:hypothetical protein
VNLLESECELVYNQHYVGSALPIRFGFKPDSEYGNPGVDSVWRTARWWRDRDTFTVYVTPRKRKGWKARVRVVTDTDNEVNVERET